MKTAVVGSRGLNIDYMQFYIPSATTEIISGGAKGIDAVAKSFAEKMNYQYTEFLPSYERYGRAAPLKRNDKIIDYADIVVAIWDGKSKGTKYTIDKCKKNEKSLIVYNVYICEETGYADIDHSEYYNLSSLGNEKLKEIIIAELDGKADIDINTGLIKACVEAIVENKRIPILGIKNIEQLNKSIKEAETFVKQIIGEI